ncbi:hypothetical protein J010_02564 [Cryptococcus neoformans]|uniref:Uncharacterized protein n=1 Tax=Cryptococcus neoformans Tu259-1 TaxID=1230072 RepID=A0A854QCQ0_CRYNE|nr:hypothetical protein C353_02687 [Cryptococcus neoformans var. grubii AD1-83a]OWZ58470.1 hypothetical protein C368_00635 [Cryptococcus neoformans var. grubii 125.91]OXG22352.1 hypothetical protein C361_03011 [Cryptococcus neoformans var. grubii Tu259-1]OXG51055.1 hypothetical protein C355_02495 [Cryptococcus neoformans var. grubii Th84]OXG61494.1 hypothetical protein C354_02623 [Cryptococcus neoformans var. grubii MW-RSA1955]OXG64799.1 hypothetical protein C351_02408 [Cryptococcus neoformans
MHESPLARILRRSRLRALASAAGHALHLDGRAHAVTEVTSGSDAAVDKRFYASLNEYSPQQLSSMAAAQSLSAAAAAASKSAAATHAASTTRQAAQAATLSTSQSRARSTVAKATSSAHTTTSSTSSRATSSTTSSAKSSAASSILKNVTASSSQSSSSAAKSSTTSTASRSTVHSTSTRSSSTSTSHSTSTVHTSSADRELTSTVKPSTTSHSSSAIISSSSISSTAAGLSNSTNTSSSLSTGAVVGIVFAVVIGIVAVGSFGGWLYRKYITRSYNKTNAPWSKIDDDITPFDSEKPHDDIYGGPSAPVIASSRDLAHARSIMSPREYTMFDGASNHAGVGAGRTMGFAAEYPTGLSPPPEAVTYGVDLHGRPYTPQAGRTPMLHTYESDYGHPAEIYSPYSYQPYSVSPTDNMRQLVGPNAYHSQEQQHHTDYVEMPMPSAMPLGGLSHASDEDLKDLDEFADDPQMAGLAYAYEDNPAAGSASIQTGEQIPTVMVSSVPSKHDPPAAVTRANDHMAPNFAAPDFSAPAQSPLSPLDPTANNSSSSSNALLPLPLPQFEPLSPLTTSFDLNGRTSEGQPLAMYEDEHRNTSEPDNVQKRLYGEVARTAGIVEPKTPFAETMSPSTSTSPEPMPLPSTNVLNESTNSTSSSFSAPGPAMPRLPDLSLNPPRPYQHGQPLSPLAEVPTPMSSSIGGEGGMSNPFDNPSLTVPTSAMGRAPAPPYSPYEPYGSYDPMGSPAPSSAGVTRGTSGHGHLTGGLVSPAFPPPSPGGNVPGSVTDSPRRWSRDDVYGGI